MSDDENAHSSSGSDSEADDMEKNGLVATREKRSNAGSLYAILRNTLDDTQLQEGLMDDDDDDVGDYQESDREDDDAAMESSSDEDDAGPPKEGEEDLEGERALQKSERAEARKKRKVKDAKLKLPAWAAKKRVKLAADVKTEDGAPKPKKKSERANWLPSPADAPTRQSSRSLAMASRETTHAHLKQSFQRSEKQRKIMKNAAHREKTTKRADLTLGQRMEKAARIAKETKREFGKWEREELERQRIRDELLAAKRSRGLEGPFIRYWSGSGIWNGQKFVVTRNLPQKEREMLSMTSKKSTDTVEERKTAQEKNDDHAVDGDAEKVIHSTAEQAPTIRDDDQKASIPAFTESEDTIAAQNSAPPATSPGPTDEAVQWLSGIHDYAALTTTNQPPEPTQTKPLAPPSTTQPTLVDSTIEAPPAVLPTPSAMMSSQNPLPSTYHGWPPGAQQTPAVPPLPPPPPAPIIREQALRACIMLEQFEELDPIKKAKTSSALEPTPTAKLLLPAAHATSFSADEAKYLTSKHRKVKTGDNIPPPPPKPRCAITAWPAKYRDPKTGLAYFDMQMYKAVQRILAGGSMWSGLLGAWVGPAPGGISIGRPASGVPEGFSGPPPVVKVEVGNA